MGVRHRVEALCVVRLGCRWAEAMPYVLEMVCLAPLGEVPLGLRSGFDGRETSAA